MVVETGSGGNVRPEEVVTALMDRGLALDPETMKIHREGLYIGSDTGLDSSQCHNIRRGGEYEQRNYSSIQ